MPEPLDKRAAQSSPVYRSKTFSCETAGFSKARKRGKVASPQDGEQSALIEQASSTLAQARPSRNTF